MGVVAHGPVGQPLVPGGAVPAGGTALAGEGDRRTALGSVEVDLVLVAGRGGTARVDQGLTAAAHVDTVLHTGKSVAVAVTAWKM